ncbi:MAG: hypothetical protein AAB403_14745 [Planctomycetota bacterium]
MARMVDPFDLILLWPVRLRRREEKQSASAHARAVLDKSACRWTREEDLLRREKEGINDGYAWGEFAYFYPFFRRFLYGDSREGRGGAEFALYRLSPGKAEWIVVGEKDWKESFQIKQVWLYIMENDTAILKVDLAVPKPISWDSALNATSELRKTYYSHWYQDPGDGTWKGGGARSGIYLKAGESPTDAKPSPEDRQEEMKESLSHRQPRLLPHWADLLQPMILGPAGENSVGFEVLGDNRMAVMAFAGTESPETLSEHEWFALSQADGAGFNPCAAGFRDAELAKVCYDRWWDPQYADPEQQKQRYITGPMTFATVVKARSAADPYWLASNREKWRRQYFQLFFLTHYQRAALLILQHQIAETADLLQSGKRGVLLEKIRATQQEMARFSSRCWFADVTPQIQGQELYLGLKSQLSLDQLYKEVMDDKGLLADWVMSEFRQRLESIVIPAAIILGLLGINVFFDPAREFFGWVVNGAVQRLRWAALQNTTFKKLATDCGVALCFAVPAYWVIRRWIKTR